MAKVSGRDLSRLKKKLESLKGDIRSSIREDLIEAADLGDLFRENHPFDDAVARQRINERKIVELEAFVNSAQLEDEDDKKQVRIGSVVKLRDEKGAERTLKLVTPEQFEVDDESNLVSTESMLGKKIYGKHIDEVIQFDKNRMYYIISIA